MLYVDTKKRSSLFCNIPKSSLPKRGASPLHTHNRLLCHIAARKIVMKNGRSVIEKINGGRARKEISVAVDFGVNALLGGSTKYLLHQRVIFFC